ncbi:MAG: hypothetical protein N4A72_09695 [Bacteroidales bacterium]|jgi:hypothetical protein|nr:hypothetical protein [Bacteroidales bacterium]
MKESSFSVNHTVKKGTKVATIVIKGYVSEKSVETLNQFFHRNGSNYEEFVIKFTNIKNFDFTLINVIEALKKLSIRMNKKIKFNMDFFESNTEVLENTGFFYYNIQN